MSTLHELELPMTQPGPQSVRMDVRELRLGLACNQHCTHCHLHTTQRDPSDASILPQIRDLATAGVSHVVVTGGEPTLSPNLMPALADLQARGIGVTLETNGVVLASAKARQRLRDLGVQRLTVHLPATEAARYAAQTRDPESFPSVVATVQTLLAEGWDVGVAMPVLATNLQDVADLPRFLAEKLQGVARATLRTYAAQPPHALIRLHPHPRDWQTAVQAAVSGLQAAGIDAAFVRGDGLPACLLTSPQAVPHLVARGKPRQPLPEACAGCTLAADCPGPPQGLLEAHPELRVKPFANQGLLRKLDALQPRSQPVDNYVRDILEADGHGGEVVREVLLRILQQCNERCRFCWIDFDAAPCPEALIDEALLRVATLRPPPIVSFTGGEPTLHPQLEAFVQRARTAGASQVTLQTNATLCADVERGSATTRAQRLAAAGLTHALVGLHAHTEAGYRRVTAVPNAFARAVAGVQALLSAGIHVDVNHVLNRENANDVEGFVRLAARELVGSEGQRPVLVFAAAAEIGGGPIEPGVLARLSDYVPSLQRALDFCLDQGIAFAGLSHPCGFPPCLFGGNLAYFHDIERWRVDGQAGVADGALPGDRQASAPVPVPAPAPVPAPVPAADRAPVAARGKAPGCSECVFDRYCPGLRPEYAAVHGTSELTPILTWPAAPQARQPMSQADLRPLQVAIIGLGGMGQRQAAIAAAHGATVFASSRRAAVSSPATGVTLHASTGAADLTTADLDGCDLVCLCTETDAHLADGLSLIAALGALPTPGLLLIEKPLASTAADADTLVAAAHAARVPLFVHHTQVGDPGLRALHDTLPALGAIERLRLHRREPARLPDPRLESPEMTGLLHQHLVHEWSLVQALLGPQPPPTQVTGSARLGPGTLHLALTAQAGAVSIELTGDAAQGADFARELVIEGSLGRLRWRQRPGARELWLERPGAPPKALRAASGDGLAAVLVHLLALAAARRLGPTGRAGSQPWLTEAVSGEAGVRVLRAVEAIVPQLSVTS